MQKKQPPKELPPSSQNIMATILQSMPKEASITKIEYEGPRIALYTNSPRYLLENNETISKLTKGGAYYREKGVEHNVFNNNNFPYSFIEVELKE